MPVTQNHIDNTGNPSTDGEAGQGSTLSVHATHMPVPSCITGVQDVDEEDTEISMLKNDVDDLIIFGLDDATRVERNCETGNPTSLVEVTWCFEPSQPRRITSGLKTNVTLSPSYSFHKSSHHKSYLFEPIHIPWTLNTGTCIQQGDLFYSAGLHKNRC